MRRNIYLSVIIPTLAFCQMLSVGDYADPVLPSERQMPYGIRSAGMGGTGIAVSEDLSALFYNPANLGYIYRIEVAGALHYDAFSYESVFDNVNSRSGSDSYIKLATLGAVIPVPTSRGGLAFALGFTRTNSFDRRLKFSGTGADGIIYDGDESSNGGLGKFCIGAGIQVSPYASLGMSLDLYAGGEKYSWFLDRRNPGGTSWHDSVERKIISDDIIDEWTGVGARFATTIVPNKYFQFGAHISTPTALTIDEEGIQRFDSITTGWEIYSEQSDIVESIDLTLPWKFGAGIAIRPTDWLLFAGDGEFCDWRQIEYSSPSWIIAQNRLMDTSFRATFRWSAGTEITVPLLAMKVRGGFSQEPVPYLPQGRNRNINTITGGLGFLVGEMTSIDASVNFSKLAVEGDRLDENYSIARVWLGLSYRF